ncbi:hypothetical protein CYLTODRAFT_351111 [Cylindrobasidium torrendii FP15055 ss-10]|uniref:Brf1 TBP-binding domain-containing protein n=1 Tax=Cylindrobasidium torrendii FP15055 ss-10 TaxID=1314674 RepID=A0A0D7BET1_9AGAR|nr:hypothetical protein CYLTODRAFT_351111 [Cylindrobasidium torrendii FP15055 ss-10]
MTAVCVECGGGTVWDDDAASFICMTCGTLADASQCILTSGLEYRTEPLNGYQPSTLKSLRNPNWQLAGQGRESAHAQNAAAMNQWITSLASALSASGLAQRTCHLFNQAMKAGQFRWGRKAKLVAGACLSIALRESKRPDSRVDIASLLDEKDHQLTRVLSEILSLLNMKLAPNDPSFYLPILQKYLSAALSSDQDTLPTRLREVIAPLSMPKVLKTAHELSDLLARSIPHTSAIQASAAAIMILALEGQVRKSITGLADLAAFLALHAGAGKSLIQKQYTIFQDELARLMTRIPWLSQYDKKAGARAKVAKRILVARGLEDILTWGRDSWKEQHQALARAEFLQEEGDCVPSCSPEDVPAPHPQKKKRKLRHTLSDASQFLLDPTAASMANSTFQSSLTSYLLNASSEAMQQQSAPTRLQLLLVSKNGDDLEDEELFADGELEGMLRNEEEVAMFARIWHQSNPDYVERSVDEPKAKRRRRDKNEPKEPSKRINRDALAQFMGDEDDEEMVDILTGVNEGVAVWQESDEEDESEFGKIRKAMALGLQHQCALTLDDDEQEWY